MTSVVPVQLCAYRIFTIFLNLRNEFLNQKSLLRNYYAVALLGGLKRCRLGLCLYIVALHKVDTTDCHTHAIFLRLKAAACMSTSFRPNLGVKGSYQYVGQLV